MKAIERLKNYFINDIWGHRGLLSNVVVIGIVAGASGGLIVVWFLSRYLKLN